MTSGFLPGARLFVLAYFLTLSMALVAAFLYRRWNERETRRRFENLMRQRASLREMLKILSREAGEISSRSDEDLAHWLVRGPTYMPEGQALRDVDTELEILQGELRRLRSPQGLKSAQQHLAKTVDRAREWIGRVLGAGTVGEIRAALLIGADGQTLRELARANERVRQFAALHGIKEQDSFYHDSYF